MVLKLGTTAFANSFLTDGGLHCPQYVLRKGPI